MNIRREVACNLCGAGDTELVYETFPERGEAAGTKIFASTCDYLGHEFLVRCKACGLMYFNPQMRPDDVLQGYAQVEDKAYTDQQEGRLQTFAACWRKMSKYLPPSGRILDVGAAAGYFLHVAKKEGWDAHGVEPNNGLRRFAREKLGVEIEAATLKEAAFPDASFDAVTLWDVLEHTPDPKSVLEDVRRVLKPGGLLVVSYPDISDPAARLFGKRWWFLLSAHLYYFTPKTIKAMLENRGFTLLAVRPHFQQLPFGYLLQRLKTMLPLASRILRPAAAFLGLAKVLIPYYASQRCVYARKGGEK